jgi:protein-S-isoprenylcysteine O-methyltransferase Ste14
MNLTETLTVISVGGWPIIPIAWIPMHGLPSVRKKLGLFYYIFPFTLWLPIVYFIYTQRSFLSDYAVEMPFFLVVFGWILIASGLTLFLYSLALLKPWVIIGLPQVYHKIKANLVTAGPYRSTRNPVYLAHFMILLGIFFATGSIFTFGIAVLDFLVANFIIIPLEEKELIDRFGKQFVDYMNKIPRFFPNFGGA